MCSVGLAVGSSFIAAVRARASYHSSGSVFAGSIVGSVFLPASVRPEVACERDVRAI